MTEVACLAAVTDGVDDVTMTSTLSLTNSVAISAKRSLRPSAQRYSIETAVNLSPAVAGLFLVRRGGLGKAVTELERKNLVETDRHIAECKEYIAKQRDLIERAVERGRSTEVAETTLEALEASLRAFERRRRLLLDRLKERER